MRMLSIKGERGYFIPTIDFELMRIEKKKYKYVIIKKPKIDKFTEKFI